MPKVEDIRILNIDGVPHAVEGMSDTVKRMVEIYNEWNQREAEVQSELMMVQSARNDLSRQIILQVRKEKEEAEGGDADDATSAEGEAPAEATNDAE